MNHRLFTIFLLTILLISKTVTAEELNIQTYQRDFSEGKGWALGLAATFCVSITGFLMAGILLLILRTKRLSQATLNLIITILIAFAIGALLGDAIVHIIPEVFGAHEHGGEEEVVVHTSHEESHDEHHEHSDTQASDHDDELHEDDHVDDIENHIENDEEVHDDEHEGESVEEVHVHEEDEPIPAITSLLILAGFGVLILFERALEACGIHHSHGPPGACPHSEKAYTHTDRQGEEMKDLCENKEMKKLEDLALKENKVTSLPEQDVEGKVATLGDLALKENKLTSLPEQDVEGKVASLGELALKETKSTSTSAPEQDLEGQVTNQAKKKGCWETLFSLKGRGSSGIMILIADFIHNIMDGLALGVAFASGKKDLAISTFIAILAHEIPQELGDMGILVGSNFPKAQALCCNGVINFSSMIGAIIGLAVGSVSESVNAYIMAFVAGNFIYISLVSMLPVVAAERRPKQSLALLLAFVLGAGTMFALLPAED